MGIRPQPGPQEAFLGSPADIAIFGGAAGGGKSFALLLEPLRHINHPGFGAVIFRRTSPQIRNEGGLWDESEGLYAPLGLRPRESTLEWENPSNKNTIKFSHLEHDKTVYDWQGSQVALIGFDELTHFSSKQFWYMLSRNRSTSGVRPYIRATTNPDADSWVADFLAWWIDQDPDSATYGLPIPERAGVVRWFARIGGEAKWGDNPADLVARHPGCEPKSATFIPSSLDDNPALTEKDPGYRANLMALDPVEQARLLGGNWKARPNAGAYFNRAWVQVIDQIPQLKRIARAWDFAASRPTADNPNPDWTVGIKGGITEAGQIIVLDLVKTQDNPGEVETLFSATAKTDGRRVTQRIPQDPAAAGKAHARHMVQVPGPGITVRAKPVSGDKVLRFGPASARAYQHMISFVRAPWNDWLFNHLEAFPTAGVHDDPVDALGDLVNELAGRPKPKDTGQTSFSTYTLT